MEHRSFIFRPFLDAAEMEYRPAKSARPDAGFTAKLTCADGALVQIVGDVLVYAGR